MIQFSPRYGISPRWMVAPAGAMLLVAASASADILHFSVFENEVQAPPAGLNLSMGLLSAGPSIDFTFQNQSTTGSVISTILVENTPLSSMLLLNGRIVTPMPAGVNFSIASPAMNPPGSIASFGGPWRGTLFAIGATSPAPQNGIGPGESLTVRFDLGGAYTSLVQGFENNPPELRIAQHIRAFGDQETSLWTLNEALNESIPAPGAAVIGLLALAGVGYRRSR
jgi:hypothetical protein